MPDKYLKYDNAKEMVEAIYHDQKEFDYSQLTDKQQLHFMKLHVKDCGSVSLEFDDMHYDIIRILLSDDRGARESLIKREILKQNNCGVSRQFDLIFAEVVFEHQDNECCEPEDHYNYGEIPWHV